MNAAPKVQQRRSAKFKADVAFHAIAGVSRQELCSKHGLSEVELSAFIETFISGGREAFTSRRDDASKDAEIARLQQKVGELFMRLDGASRASANGSAMATDDEI